MQTEFWARGLADLDDGGAGVTRTTRWINDAMHVVDELCDWPYLNTTTTGTAPLTIADLRTVESVTAVGNLQQLEPVDRRDMRQYVADLTTVGTPTLYYITGGTTINVYPASTSTTLTVDYWKFGPDLSGASDAPLMPDRFRYIIVDYAVAQALRDRGDLQGAAEAQRAGDDRLQVMQRSLLSPQHQAPAGFAQLVGDDL
jgi:hypothetical protein